MGNFREIPKNTVDNGPEFIVKRFFVLAEKHQIFRIHANPGKPIENGFMEGFQGKLRNHCLNLHRFNSLADRRERSRFRDGVNSGSPMALLEIFFPMSLLNGRHFQDELKIAELVGTVKPIPLN